MAHSRPVALVTGARRGIGAALALALARAEFGVVITDIAEDDDARATIAALLAAGAKTYLHSGASRRDPYTDDGGRCRQVRPAHRRRPGAHGPLGRTRRHRRCVAALASGHFQFATGSVMNLDGGLAIPGL